MVKVVDKDDPKKWFITFDKSICKTNKKFEIDQEVEVLDGSKCFQRGVITQVKKDNVNVDLKYKVLSVKNEFVYNCGEKLPGKECSKKSDLIKIKFCKGGAELDICKRILSFKYYDTGDVLSDKLSDGMFK